MWKRSVSGAILAASLAAQAQAQTDTVWVFHYTGFERDGVFFPEEQASGSFRGSDADGDGVVEQSEISRFTWLDRWFDPQDSAYCTPYRCTLDDFSYSLDGRLAFTFDWVYSDEAAYSTGRTVAGDHTYRYASARNGVTESAQWNWTDQTRFTISPAPVPEPGQSLLLVSGLLGLGAWRAARRRRS